MSPPIFTPDGSEVSEIVLPDGSTTSEVIGPDGNVVFEAGPDIPDSGNLQAQYAARLLSGLSDGDTVDPFSAGSAGPDAPLIAGDAVYRESQVNGYPSVEYDGSSAHDTGLTVDTTQPRSVYCVWLMPGSVSSETYPYGFLDQDPSNFDRFYGVVMDGQDGDDIRVGYGDNTVQGGSGLYDEYLIQTSIYGGGSMEGWINDGSELTGTYNGVGAEGETAYLGARSNDGSVDGGLDGQLVELLDYQADHNSATRQSVWDYLNNIYGIF